MRAYMSDEMADSPGHKDQLHLRALATYDRWQADRKRRLAEDDTRVAGYHASLDKAAAEVTARDRAIYAAYVYDRLKAQTGDALAVQAAA